MKKILYAVAALLALASCEEFQPVFTANYTNPKPYEPAQMEANITIADLAKYYIHGTPICMGEKDPKGKIIKGRISTTDQPGNFYKSFYIQDESGGMEIKIGKNGLYNDYLEGQEVYIVCDNLYLGEYGYKSNSGNGMVQIGYSGKGTDYETSYIDSQLLIDTHIFRGDPKDIQKVTPEVLTDQQLPISSSTLASCKYIGKMVTIRGLRYGWTDPKYKEYNEAFALLYINSQKDKKSSSNRIFISGEDTGLDRWGLSKERMSEYLESGMWDDVNIGNANDYSYGKVGDPRYAYQGYYKDKTGAEHWDVDEQGNPIKTYPAIERNAYSVSQYFSTASGTGIQIRTSGFGKFADAPIDPGVLDGTKTIDVTGILTLYQGNIQVTVNRFEDIKIN